jgi:hypothetical protein
MIHFFPPSYGFNLVYMIYQHRGKVKRQIASSAPYVVAHFLDTIRAAAI